jgi:hypothetical protein
MQTVIMVGADMLLAFAGGAMLTHALPCSWFDGGMAGLGILFIARAIPTR